MSEKSQSDPPKYLNDGLPIPSLIVLDLDYTLWDFWVDTHVLPPITQVSEHHARDRTGKEFGFYAGIPKLLRQIKESNTKLAVASRTQAPRLAQRMLQLLSVEAKGDGAMIPAIDIFDILQIFPGSKIKHFMNIREQTGMDYSDMLFFDDEERNMNVDNELGVVFHCVPNGFSSQALDEGIEAWRARWKD